MSCPGMQTIFRSGGREVQRPEKAGFIVLPQRLHRTQRPPGPTSTTTGATAATPTHNSKPRHRQHATYTHTLKHLEWFDSVSHDDLFESPNNTWTQIPRPLRSAYHEAKATVINELARPEHHDPNNPNTTRLWILLIHMDQLLLHTNKRPHGHNETASQTTTLAQRLFLFWNGSWDTLLTEPEPSETSHALPPDNTKFAQRVETLTQQGEVG